MKLDKDGRRVCMVKDAYMYGSYGLDGKVVAFLWPIRILVEYYNPTNSYLQAILVKHTVCG